MADIRKMGVFIWESLSLTVDLVQALGMGAVEALKLLVKGKILDGKSWKEWAFHYMPNHVDDKTLLAVYFLMSLTPVDEETRKAHLQLNRKGWETYHQKFSKDAYIEDQNRMKGILVYGNHDADYNACEVIAVYNALMSMHDGVSPVSFPDLLYHFEGAGIAAGGEFGTDPSALHTYLEEAGYETKMISGIGITAKALDKMQEQYDTYILTTYNNRDDVGAMIHTISITKEVDQFMLHNAGMKDLYDTLENAIRSYKNGNSEPISVIGVK